MVKTAAIINYWDGGELLPYAVENWFKCVDEVIIVFSLTSNYGEQTTEPYLLESAAFKKCILHRQEPLQGVGPRDNERHKRNVGLELARRRGLTHFVTADSDEFYDPDEFKTQLSRFDKNPNLNGLCCDCEVYFKRPTLSAGKDVTIVPFIHRITPSLSHAWNPQYPYAFVNRQIRIDPTRQFNITSGVEWSNITMHHFSWVRKDIETKIRNSTARYNIEASTIREDFVIAEAGRFVNFYGRTLHQVPNRFRIPDYGDFQQNLLGSQKPMAPTGPANKP